MKRYLRRLIYDIKETIKFFRVRRTFRKSNHVLVMTQIQDFNNPKMYICNDIIPLIKQKKIDVETLSNYHEGGTVCIGFSPANKKWYGWSHRAVHGFGIGDVVSEGDITNTSGYIEEFEKEHPEIAFKLMLPIGFTAKTLEDAKLMAIAYASAVS